MRKLKAIPIMVASSLLALLATTGVAHATVIYNQNNTIWGSTFEAASLVDPATCEFGSASITTAAWPNASNSITLQSAASVFGPNNCSDFTFQEPANELSEEQDLWVNTPENYPPGTGGTWHLVECNVGPRIANIAPTDVITTTWTANPRTMCPFFTCYDAAQFIIHQTVYAYDPFYGEWEGGSQWSTDASVWWDQCT